jgi:hypothetical protein
MLGRFGLSGHHHLQPIVKLSGGQKARVVFTAIALSNPHILLLDEPTNHLDMQARRAALRCSCPERTARLRLAGLPSTAGGPIPHPAARLNPIRLPTCSLSTRWRTRWRSLRAAWSSSRTTHACSLACATTQVGNHPPRRLTSRAAADGAASHAVSPACNAPQPEPVCVPGPDVAEAAEVWIVEDGEVTPWDGDFEVGGGGHPGWAALDRLVSQLPGGLIMSGTPWPSDVAFISHQPSFPGLAELRVQAVRVAQGLRYDAALRVCTLPACRITKTS